MDTPCMRHLRFVAIHAGDEDLECFKICALMQYEPLMSFRGSPIPPPPVFGQKSQHSHFLPAPPSSSRTFCLPRGMWDTSGSSSADAGREVEDAIFVAVPQRMREGRRMVLWTLRNLAKRGSKLVVAHVHTPVPLALIPVGKDANAYRILQRKQAETLLDEYDVMCITKNVRSEKLVIEMDDVATGLVELIARHGVTKLVMGAAADERFSVGMKTPKSRKANRVMEAAPTSCKIWFTCNGSLICKREAHNTVPAMPASPAPSTTSLSSPAQLHALALHKMALHEMNTIGSSSTRSPCPRHGLNMPRTEVSWNEFLSSSCLLEAHNTVPAMPASPAPSTTSFSVFAQLHAHEMNTIGSRSTGSPTPRHGLNMPRTEVVRSSSQEDDHSRTKTKITEVSWDEFPSRSQSSGYDSGSPRNDDEFISSRGRIVMNDVKEIGSAMHPPSFCPEQWDLSADADIIDNIVETLVGFLKKDGFLKKELSYEEFNDSPKAKRVLLSALQRFEVSEGSYRQQLRQKIEKMKRQIGEIYHKLYYAEEDKRDLQQRVTVMESTNEELQARCEKLQCERDAAVAEAEDLRQQHEQWVSWSPPDDAGTPSYFVCPISREVMKDPHFAADGFTYEAEAIRTSLASGNDRSPITNMKLAHDVLTPNRALRSEILQWQQQHHRHHLQ